MLKRFAFLLILWLFLFQSVYACGCFSVCLFKSPKQCARKRLKSADAVFYGKVIEIDGLPVRPDKPPEKTVLSSEPEIDIDPVIIPFGGYYKVKFSIEKAWKGITKREIIVKVQANDGANCGINLKLGESYLFFSAGNEDSLTLGGCSLGDDAFPYLGKGYKPTSN
jgi:hypothetical protein